MYRVRTAPTGGCLRYLEDAIRLVRTSSPYYLLLISHYYAAVSTKPSKVR